MGEKQWLENNAQCSTDFLIFTITCDKATEGNM